MKVQGDTTLQTEVLEDLSEAVNYRAWLVALTQPYLGARAIEIGSGTGDYAVAYADAGVRITASEADPVRLAGLQTRFASDERVDVRELAIPLDIDADYDAAVALNVLEHIPDHVEGLRSFARLVRPGGAVVLIVPAFPIGMSKFDRAIGHQRRYRKATMRAALESAGLRVEVLRHVNGPGLVAWIVGMRLLRLQPGSGPVLRVWDGTVIPRIRRREQRKEPRFGQSILAVARRPQA
ncbi:MAG: class I SAM-dependent methyltransferase [Actinomycetes bacterium]